jgi:hypothetical protein
MLLSGVVGGGRKLLFAYSSNRNTKQTRSWKRQERWWSWKTLKSGSKERKRLQVSPKFFLSISVFIHKRTLLLSLETRMS